MNAPTRPRRSGHVPPARWVVVLVAAVLSGPALATKHRRPFNAGIGLGHGFDNNYGGGGCTDWGCGGTCYDGHTGSDFPVGLGTDVLAGAPGTVVQVNNGCANYGYYGNPCGGKCGNYVRLQHADGTRSLYCHMKLDSIVVSVGQGVACGQKLGQSASSGSSTGPHLHFGWQVGGVSRDPFSGGCASGGGWVSQGGYPGFPSTACEITCACSPGETQTQGCGLCGSQVRSCGGDCQWGGWSGCQGQGPCSPGAVESGGCGNCGQHQRACGGNCQWGGWSACAGEGPCAAGAVEQEACCTCGSRARTCSAACQWNGWSACGGPDPAGSPACDTGLLGDCGRGTIRCLEGCLACTQTVFPSPERCDDHDSDCDGVVDDDAIEVGEPPALYAAELVDLSVPDAVGVGEVVHVWARFRNVGRAAWPPGRVWLNAVDLGGGPSPFWVDDAWSAFDAAAVLPEWTAAGDTASLAFPVRMPLASTPGSRFTLVFDGAALRCPSPGFDVTPVALSGPAARPRDPVPSAPPPTPEAPPALECPAGCPDDRADAGTPPVTADADDAPPADATASDVAPAGSTAPAGCSPAARVPGVAWTAWAIAAWGLCRRRRRSGRRDP